MRHKDYQVHKISEQEERGPAGLVELPTENGEMGFTTLGREVEVDSVDCFCKVMVETVGSAEKEDDEFIENLRDNEQIIHYFIKTGLSGFMFDPWGMFSEGRQAKEATHMGRPAWNFSRVSEKCFQYYLKFLQSQNKAWLLQAERVL